MDDLTPREKEAAVLAASGMSNAELAEQMGTTIGTVKNYVHRALEKTGAYDRRELVTKLADWRVSLK